MKHGFVLPYAEARDAAELARLAESSGWDGFFVWEPVWGIDAWVTLAAAAMCTERIRLGTMLSPVARMRPWKLASETATLDRLSNGRVTLAVGLGAPDTGWAAFGEPTDRKTRAELTDECLEIVTGLWRGQPYSYTGKHYTVTPFDFMPPPPPVQQPRIPIWVVGVCDSARSLARVARYDGLIPSARGADGKMGQATPSEIRAALDQVKGQHPTDSAFDVIVEGVTPVDDAARAAEIKAPWEAAGATWWLEAMWAAMPSTELSYPDAVAQVRDRIAAGPKQ
jgi:alkanesulfonate monooxygenase SsuD/methylene tetrahydromethanopterin reductase-like flavin-dependent oxidoreductase (luciferase family)